MELEDYLADLRERQEAVRPPGTPREVTYPAGEISLPAHVRHWADERPEQVAIAFGGRDIPYAELADLVASVSGWLVEAGVRPGDRVAVYLPNSPQFVVAMLAVLQAGAVHVPVNPMLKAAELTHELSDCGAEVVVALYAFVPTLRDLQKDTAVRHVLTTHATEMTASPSAPEPPGGSDDAGDSGAGHPAATGDLVVTPWSDATAHAPGEDRSGDLDALAALNYTSGTTGLPKGCEHTQRHMVYTAASAHGAYGFVPGEPYASLCYLPIFWIAGEDLGILNPIVQGGTSVLMTRWDATQALDLIERYGVGMMVGTVENYLELLAREDLRDRDLSSLTLPLTVSFVQVLDPAIRRAWREAVGEHSVLREAAYGMTETHTLDVVPFGLDAGDADLLAEPIYCGVPVPGTDVAVVQPGTMTPAPIGDTGEIIVRSPAVTTGYWRRPDATEAQLRDGWVLTGDTGRIDEQGCLHFLGRAKDMIKVKGMSVFPAEVEKLLGGHPEVDVAAVVPVPDPEHGQLPVAFVTLAAGSGLDAAGLEAWAREAMASYKVPRVVIVEEFPMTDTGKIRKVGLVDQARQTFPTT